jgi:hypothetical protein
MARHPMLDHWLRDPRQLRFVFLAVMILLASVLGFLGWSLYRQDRLLSAKRLDDQRETAAGLIVPALEKRISRIEENLARTLETGVWDESSLPTQGAVFVEFQSGSIRVWPENALLYYPELPETVDSSGALFVTADKLEAKRDRDGAIAASQIYASSADKDIRAAALIRIARNQRIPRSLSFHTRSSTASWRPPWNARGRRRQHHYAIHVAPSDCATVSTSCCAYLRVRVCSPK